jgi:undecaprenyl-diphosphatase
MELNRRRRWIEAALGIRSRLGLNEAAPLLTLSIVGLLGWGFIELADEVGEGSTHALDARLLLSLRNPADLSDPIGPG